MTTERAYIDSLAGTLFVLLQRVLPKHLMTRIVYRLSRITLRPVKNWLITRFAAAYKVDVNEAALPVPDGFANFNAFFTRELAAGARPIDTQPNVLVSPVDGTVSAAGRLNGETLLQAKGIDYTLTDLLATDLADTRDFSDGSYATLYLAPYNYHRVHCPAACELVSARYVPGKLYSVNDTTVSRLPDLFTGNERLICHFRSATGPMILVFVGALHVGSISTPWTGEIRPRKRGVVEERNLHKGGHTRQLARGDLLGWFNMGSTVILLLPGDHCSWLDNMVPGNRLKMGERIANLSGSRS
ncbi:MAG TPA: archaetidylserine decarboxylase [Woeseiaceae bacterium]|nr:archaetidylserine decarboxylase [Woeseiaceae bacterium]